MPSTGPRIVGALRPAASRLLLAFALVGAIVVVAGILAAHQPRSARALGAVARRWREMHTPGAGRDGRVLGPDGPNVALAADALRAAGLRSFRFTPALGDAIGISPFLVEAAWPIECRLVDENVVGYATDFESRSDCTLVAIAGDLALGHCPL